jgi:hypothetical protein
LEYTLAGKYLSKISSSELKNIISPDFNLRRSFPMSNEGSFSTSVNGFWRELSARRCRCRRAS